MMIRLQPGFFTTERNGKRAMVACVANEHHNLQRINEVIKTSSEFMLPLLEELLDMVKIESGNLYLNL